MNTHIIHPHRCPHCGHKMNMVAQMGTPKEKWKIDHNCISFCSSCTKMFVFNDDGEAKKITKKQMEQLKSHPGMVEQLQRTKEQLMRERFKI